MLIIFLCFINYILMSKYSILSYLKNGSDYFPFGDKPQEGSSVSEGSFVPFQVERNKIGRLVTEQTSQAPLKTKKSLVKLHKFKSIDHGLGLPYVQTPQQESQYTEPHKQYDPVTKYLTLLTTTSKNEDHKSLIDLKQYTLHPNQVERGLLGQGSKQLKGNEHKVQLISKRTKNLLSQTPAVGLYNPHPLKHHLPNIKLRSKPNEKAEVIIDKHPITKTPPKKKSKNNDFEMVFAKEIQQINRDVEQEMKRNPNQQYFISQFEVQTAMNLDEAEAMRNRMKAHFQSVKDSLTKMKNLINIKR